MSLSKTIMKTLLPSKTEPVFPKPLPVFSAPLPSLINGRIHNEAVSTYQQTIQDALSLLGKRNLSLIIHGSSFPSNPQADTGFGSPYSQSAQQFVYYIKTLGFNGIQLGPGGKTKAIDPSPYVSTTFSANPLFIDLKALSEDPAWCGLLSTQTFESIVVNKPESENTEQKHYAAYSYTYEYYQGALSEAFERFESLINNIQQKPAKDSNGNSSDIESIKPLKASFDKFYTQNAQWLESDALYEALSIANQNDYWPNWLSEIDKTLAASEATAQISERKTQITRQYDAIIRRYAFEQWVAQVQKQQFIDWAANEKMQLIADRQVGFSDRDVWAYQNLFLNEWSLGAPPDNFADNGQSWGMPVLDPDQIFLPGSSQLGPAGQFLKALFDKTFQENPGGVRIDHIIGLIDPWIYRKGKKPRSEDGAGRLFSSPEHEDLRHYTLIGQDALNHELPPHHEERVTHLKDDAVKRYAQIVQLILDSAKNAGLSENALICEDLGTLTTPVKAVLEHLKLSGIRVTQFVDPNRADHLYRGKNIQAEHWVMPGSHDNEPLYRWVKGVFESGSAGVHVNNLRTDLQPEGSLASTFNLPYGCLEQDPKAFLEAKYAELFASPAQNVQVFFSDLFGIDGLYNKPGQSGKRNWALRAPNHYDAYYADQLQRRVALNLPLVLYLALASKTPIQPEPYQQKVLDRLLQFALCFQGVSG